MQALQDIMDALLVLLALVLDLVLMAVITAAILAIMGGMGDIIEPLKVPTRSSPAPYLATFDQLRAMLEATIIGTTSRHSWLERQ